MNRSFFRFFLIAAFIIGNIAFCLISRHAFAQDSDGNSPQAQSQSDNSQGQGNNQQTQGDSSQTQNGSQNQSGASGANDAYDPFLDYNEYDTSGQEEADINFFENGRLLTASFLLGGQTFTNGFHQLYENSVTYGAAFDYFFDLRFALQFSFTTSSHQISVSGGGLTKTGNATFNEFGIDLKYYFNMSDVTKGLANFNPYIITGLSPITRVQTVDGESEFARDSAVAFDAGLGFEVPIDRHQMFLGAQAEYQVVNFPDSYTQITLDSDTIQTGIYPNGGIITGLGIIGINF